MNDEVIRGKGEEFRILLFLIRSTYESIFKSGFRLVINVYIVTLGKH